LLKFAKKIQKAKLKVKNSESNLLKFAPWVALLGLLGLPSCGWCIGWHSSRCVTRGGKGGAIPRASNH